MTLRGDAALEETLRGVYARLTKGSTMIDEIEKDIYKLRNAKSMEEVQKRRQLTLQLDKYLAAWDKLLVQAQELVRNCPHTQRELVRLIDTLGSYPYERCVLCKNNVDGTGVVLANDDIRLRDINIGDLPISDDIMSPSIWQDFLQKSNDFMLKWPAD